jgi:putative transposon-encoded protein
MKTAMKVELKGYEVIERVASKGGNSARIYVPKKWVGKKVKIVLVEEVDNE